MTAYETIQMVRMLLDDQVDYALSRSAIVTLNTVINNAQDKTIAKYYKMQDERALRPLYAEMFQVYSGTTINDFLYPRGCVINVFSIYNQYQGINAKYVEYDEFLNEDIVEIGPNNNQAGNVIAMPTSYPIPMTDTAPMPTESKWTVVYPGGDVANILFTVQSGQETADIIYIEKPTPFLFDTTDFNNNIDLAMPNEFHYEICALAAHLITMSDVNEFQRESSEYAGAKLDFNTARL